MRSDNLVKKDEWFVDDEGWCHGTTKSPSPNFEARPEGEKATLVVIHNISLPPFKYGQGGPLRLFHNEIGEGEEDAFMRSVKELRVSPHFFVSREGEVTQLVSCEDMAYHAGVSNFRGKEKCNRFSIGIEVEGCDFEPFDARQYVALNRLVAAICAKYPISHVTGHSNIAPGRKTDPGPFFVWDALSLPDGVEKALD